MIPQIAHPFRGIYVSTLTPFAEDGSIHEALLAEHFEQVTACPGIVGVLCNGHAGENYLLSRQERRRVIEIAAATVGRDKIVVSGVLCEASDEAALHSADAAAAGADAILVFPPFSWALSQDEAMAMVHHERIIEAADIPIMLYQAGVRSGTLAYTPQVLARLVQLPGVVGIKEGSWESAAYDSNRRLVRSIAPHVDVMASGDEHLLSCFVAGSEGSLVSLATLIPAEIVELDRAVRNGDMKAAQALHARIQPLANVIYGRPPSAHASARLKMCLKLLERWPSCTTRAPITGLATDEVTGLRMALIHAGLLEPVLS